MADQIHQERVPEALVGQRVDRVVAFVGDLSRRQAAALVAAGEVLVDGVPVDKPSLRLELDQELSFRFERERNEPEPDPSVSFLTVHVDDEVIVVDKPAGLVVHPGSGVTGATLVNGLLHRFPEIAGVGQALRPGIVHRLDKGTSGLLVVARTEAAYEHLSDQLRRHTAERRYLALVVGSLASERGLIDAPLGRSPRDATRRAVVADGRPARTHYRVIERHHAESGDPPGAGSDVEPDQPLTLIECRLETGRTHQIRAHLAAIGHPVVGDADYEGAVAGPPAAAALPRPFLHAHRLGFNHPRHGGWVVADAALPSDLVPVLAALGLQSWTGAGDTPPWPHDHG